MFALRNKTGAFKTKLVHRDSFVQNEKQRCFRLQTIFLTNVDVNAKKLLLTL